MMDNSVEMFGETHFDTWFMVLIIWFHFDWCFYGCLSLCTVCLSAICYHFTRVFFGQLPDAWM